ncbi:nuclear transport factor 2 family protein [Arenibacter sp. GZD96]|uniref:nuclear transport factor 2 family protein n=1 Tax=Aurantibrevibacter litoralis TaxID=3106030 RepID=UPI002AFF7C9B|nr:nuclear transport factor 2 family protein [Arenibacter sp. GZD-96]MEA1784504.1 nuclear transport factor 2 family protein [Arenibacter sp. GZD-96]
MSYKEKALDIYHQLQQGKLLEAFDTYYAEDVVMTEPRGERVGKVACRAYEVEFLNGVSEFHSLTIDSIAANEEDGVTFVESTMDVTFKNGYRAKMEQVAVQRWKGDQIIHERFYYNNAQE